MSSIPTGEDFVRLVREVCSGYGFRYSYTYQTPEDIFQQAYVHAISGLSQYRASRGCLKRFLRVHIRNRLMNDKRQFYVRNDLPCKLCPFEAYINEKCTKYEDPMECAFLAPWATRNQARRMIAQPIGLTEIDPAGERSMEIDAPPSFEIEWGEIWEILEKDMEPDIRALYEVWRSGFRGKRRASLSDEEQILIENYIKKKVGKYFE